ncbi:trans-sialidase [Trypanosoma cruzi]|nr:trans-sialidase [Trypanosoma cruzi]
MIGSFRIIRLPRTASSLRSLNGGQRSPHDDVVCGRRPQGLEGGRKGESVDGGIRPSFTRVGQLTESYRTRRAGWLCQRDDRWTESHPRQPVYSWKEGEEAGRVDLRLTDMQRIYDVGPVSAENGKFAASTLLYATDEVRSLLEKEWIKLYCSHEVAAADDECNIAFVDLTEKLKGVKRVLVAWKEKDA